MTRVRQFAFVVSATESDTRLDKLIAAHGKISRGLARRVLDIGGVFVDGRRCKMAGRLVRAGQRVEVYIDEEAAREALKPETPLEQERVLYADEHIVAVDKPAFVLAQATRTSERGALPERLKALLGGTFRVVHRLDKETSGVMLLARTADAASALGEAFQRGEISKTYLALCAPAPNPLEGAVDAPILPVRGRPGLYHVSPSGDHALTLYRTLALQPAKDVEDAASSVRTALVELQPKTGRTHQIRVHLAHIGAPVLGDARYGGLRRFAGREIPRVMLHALKLEFRHPILGQPLVILAQVPQDFAAMAQEFVERDREPDPVPQPDPRP